MNEHVQILSKKHGQLKQATTKMVQTVMSFLDETPDTETKLSVIETLRTVTEGKVRTRRTTALFRSKHLDLTSLYRFLLRLNGLV